MKHLGEAQQRANKTKENTLDKFILRFETCSGARTASFPMGAEAAYQWVKRPGRDADHSPPTSAEVEKTWIYTSIPPYVCMA
jgi:hypothetical protein